MKWKQTLDAWYQVHIIIQSFRLLSILNWLIKWTLLNWGHLPNLNRSLNFFFFALIAWNSFTQAFTWNSPIIVSIFWSILNLLKLLIAFQRYSNLKLGLIWIIFNQFNLSSQCFANLVWAAQTQTYPIIFHFCYWLLFS